MTGEQLMKASQMQSELYKVFARELVTRDAVKAKRSKALFLQTIENSKAFDELGQKKFIQDIKDGRLATRDFAFHAIVAATGANIIKLIDETAQRLVGIRTLSNGKLPTGYVFVPHILQIKVGTVSTSATTANILATDYGNINGEPELELGELTVKVEGNTLVNRMSCVNFNNEGSGGDLALGEYELDNSIVIFGEKVITAELETGSSAGITALSHIFFSMKGTCAMPA